MSVNLQSIVGSIRIKSKIFIDTDKDQSIKKLNAFFCVTDSHIFSLKQTDISVAVDSNKLSELYHSLIIVLMKYTNT